MVQENVYQEAGQPKDDSAPPAWKQPQIGKSPIDVASYLLSHFTGYRVFWSAPNNQFKILSNVLKLFVLWTFSGSAASWQFPSRQEWASHGASAGVAHDAFPSRHAHYLRHRFGAATNRLRHRGEGSRNLGRRPRSWHGDLVRSAHHHQWRTRFLLGHAQDQWIGKLVLFSRR